MVERPASLCKPQKYVIKPHKPCFTCRPSFDGLAYHVPKSAKEVMIHAGMYTLVMPGYCKGSQTLGRILLQTGAENSGKYQEAVAGALAKELKVSKLNA